MTRDATSGVFVPTGGRAVSGQDRGERPRFFSSSGSAILCRTVAKPDLFNYEHPGGALPHGDESVILRGLSNAEWDAFVSFGEPRRFAPGECIVRAGETCRAIYIIRAGHVRGELASGKKRAATASMGPGTVFGELAFFDGKPRSATLWADDAVDLLCLPFTAFEHLAAWHPRIARELLLDLGRVLSQRLRRAEAKA